MCQKTCNESVMYLYVTVYIKTCSSNKAGASVHGIKLVSGTLSISVFGHIILHFRYILETNPIFSTVTVFDSFGY